MSGLRKVFGAGLGLVLACAASAGELPGWWRAFPGLARMECDFVQESDSAVFGKLSRKGHLQLAKGGRLRVAYQPGLLLVADGRTLVQYDPQARTAQSTPLRRASADSPLLAVLIDPGSLGRFYTAKGGADDSLELEPRQQGLPRVLLTGRNGLPQRIQWTDGTGARQAIDFQDARVPPRAFAPAVFSFLAPAGTRWLGKP